MSSGATNCPFLMFTTAPVRAAATIMSVWRQRKAGTCNTAQTFATGAACAGSWKSVITGQPSSSRTSARMRSPSASPGPR